jgi:T3SS (YopN, CesT) and YbjN peptide-binding chaperone 3
MTVPATPDAGSTGERRPSPPAGGGEAWSTWSADLVEAVRALADGESLTVTADTADARPVLLRPARLGGFVPAKHSLVAPWVRLGRSEDFLQGHCVGSEAFGGPFPLSPEEDAALLALGWHHPGPGDGEHYVRFWPDDVPLGPYLPLDEAQRAVAMVLATFREVLLGEGVGTALPRTTRD